MRSENLEHEIWYNLAQQSNNPLKRFYFNLCADRLKAFEKESQQKYDLLLPISSVDEIKYQELDYKGESCLTPVGVDLDKYRYRGPVKPDKVIKLGYIGSLDWKPNIEGLDWLFDKVWEDIFNTYPHIEFHLAGRNNSGRYDKYKDRNVIIHGEVDNALHFMESLDVLVVPLFSGSGIRVKILEGMALGKVIMSTDKGFEGIPIKDRQNAFVFNNDIDLFAAIEFYIENFSLIPALSNAARLTIEDHFSYKQLAANVVHKLKTIA